MAVFLIITSLLALLALLEDQLEVAGIVTLITIAGFLIL
jgi:hypothetical protein